MSGRAGDPSDGATAIDVPVLIVGGGPVGLTLSILLSRLGVDSLLVERRASPTTHPQAHFINNRTMEVFRPLLGLEKAITRAQPPLDDWRHFVYCTHMLGGVELGRVDHFAEEKEERERKWEDDHNTGAKNKTTDFGRSSDDASRFGGGATMSPRGADADAVSPTTVAHFSQHRLVPLLMARAVAAHPRGREGFAAATTCVGVEQDDDGVTAELRPAARVGEGGDEGGGVSDGDGAVSEGGPPPPPSSFVRCSHLVAADGASSAVRSLAGVGMTGAPAMQHLINIHFTSASLASALRRSDKAAMLYFVFNPDVVAVVVAHDLRDDGEFVAQVPYFPPLQSLEADFSREECLRLVRAAATGARAGAGDSAAVLADVRVRSVRSWTMSAEVADVFARGRVVLCGDAAHRFPPAGGFGMNTGVQDAHNLAWKLAALRPGGGGGAGLLATYEDERRPVAAGNTRLSVSNFHQVLRIPAALGLPPAAAAALTQAVGRGAGGDGAV